jgi:hypothetical protein
LLGVYYAVKSRHGLFNNHYNTNPPSEYSNLIHTHKFISETEKTAHVLCTSCETGDWSNQNGVIRRNTIVTIKRENKIYNDLKTTLHKKQNSEQCEPYEFTPCCYSIVQFLVCCVVVLYIIVCLFISFFRTLVCLSFFALP